MKEFIKTIDTILLEAETEVETKFAEKVIHRLLKAKAKQMEISVEDLVNVVIQDEDPALAAELMI